MFFLTEEQLELQAMAKDFAQKELAPVVVECDLKGEFPMDVYKKAVEMGIHCVEVPEAFGGPGLSYVTGRAVAEEIAKVDAGFSTTLGANGLGFKPLLLAGTPEQQQHFADIVVPGGFSAFCLTEPEAGSDAGSCKTTATKVGDEYVINGRKCFVTNGGLADVYTVIASVDKSKGVKGLTMFMVDRDTPGISLGKEEDKMGIRLSNTCDVLFEDVKIPAKNIVGKEGDGFKIAMKTLDRGRASAAGTATAIAQAAMEYAIRYAKERKTFGHAIIDHQAIGFMIADMEMQIQAARGLTYTVARMIDEGTPGLTKMGAVAKCFASDMAVQVALNAIQILGGYGYMRDYPVEKLLRDAKIFQLFEGTNQIQRMVIGGNLKAEYK